MMARIGDWLLSEEAAWCLIGLPIVAAVYALLGWGMLG